MNHSGLGRPGDQDTMLELMSDVTLYEGYAAVHLANTAPINTPGFEGDTTPLGIVNAMGNVSEWTETWYVLRLGDFRGFFVAKGRTWAERDPKEFSLFGTTLVNGDLGAASIGIRCVVSASLVEDQVPSTRPGEPVASR